MKDNRFKLTLVLLFFSLFYAQQVFGAAIGDESVASFDVARIVVFPEDGSGGIAVADAIEFNTGFTVSAFFGYVACWCRACLEIWR